MAKKLILFDDFIKALEPRLAQGADTYGDSSFKKGITQLIDEIEQELLDVCGWGWILWVKLHTLRDLAKTVDATLQPPTGEHNDG